MKKVALIATSAVFCICLLAGCGSTSGTSSSTSSASDESIAASDVSAASGTTASSAADASASSVGTESFASVEDGGARPGYVDTRERTVNPVTKPEGSLVNDYAEAVKVDDVSVIEELEEDMASAVIPQYASVYIDDAADPFVICTGADDVVNLYNAITKISLGEAATPDDQTYYAVEFTMQNGDIADFVFTGRDCMVVNGETHVISNADDLWALVQALQDEAEE